MKILHVINSLNTGGAEKLIVDTLPKYIEKGLSVDLAVLENHDYPFLEVLKKDFDGQIFILGTGSVYNPKVILPLSKLMPHYDVVHVHLFPAQYYVVMANSLNKKKTKLIFTEHSTSNRRIRNKFFRPIEKYIYNQYDKTICITKRLQEIIHQHSELTYERLPVIMNGVNLKSIQEAKPIAKNFISPLLSTSDKILMQVSSMQEPKNQKTLISSLKYLPDNFKVILVGDGLLRQELEDHTKALGLADNVIFLGKRNDVPRLLKGVDYVVLSSKYEGLSLSSIEGMASGKPFIASNVPGLTEIVKGYGLVFPEGDAKSLAGIIMKLENDPALYQETVKRCQLRASEFDIEQMIDQHITLYETFQH